MLFFRPDGNYEGPGMLVGTLFLVHSLFICFHFKIILVDIFSDMKVDLRTQYAMHYVPLDLLCVKIAGPNDPRWGRVGVPRPGLPGGLP